MVVLRFVVIERDARTGQATGLLTIACQPMRSGQLGDAEEGALRSLLAWFETRVPIPGRFARKANVSHKNPHGLPWIGSGATAAIACLHAIGRIAEDHRDTVEVRKTAHPGDVVYENALQIVAEPFHGDMR